MPIPEPPEEGAKKTAAQFKSIAAGANQWFGSEAIGFKLAAAIELTGRFLIENRQIVSSGPKVTSDRPWYDNRAHFPTSDEGLIDIRKSLMRQQLFAYGVTHLIMMLVEKQVVSQAYVESDIRIDRATDLASEMVHLNLIHWDKAGRPEYTTFNLRSLMPAFLYAVHGDGNEVRDRRAFDMICLGLWSVNKIGREHKVSSGIVARMFHKYLYEPVAEFYDGIIDSPHPSECGTMDDLAFPKELNRPPFDIPIPPRPDGST